MKARQPLATDERGFALLAVILVLALLSVIVTEFAFSMRLEASMVRAYRDTILARHLAEAGIQQGIREILSEANVHALDEDKQIAFYARPAGATTIQRLPSLTRTHVPLGNGAFSYRITDEEGRLNINAGVPARVQQLLASLGVDKLERDVIADSIEDWRDSNDVHRANGAESDDYLKLPVSYRARNGNFQDTAELLQIKGVTLEMYYGQAERPGLADLVTARGRGNVNLNTAPAPVLSAVGLSAAEISEIVQARVKTPYPSVGRFGGRGPFSVVSSTFRIDAEGIVAGEPKARIIAIVQKATGSPSSVSIVSWRPAEPRSAAKSRANSP